jgi:branched-chain amino acid transport system substrate-binding protein
LEIEESGKEEVHMRRLWTFVSLALVLVLLCMSMVAACGESTPEEGGRIKIGALLSLTGGASYWGIGWKYGIEMAVEEVNEEGGFVVGGKQYTLEVVYYDDKYSATDAVAGINKLISVDNVTFVIGPLGSPAMLAIAPITEEEKVLVLGAGSSADRLGPDKPLTFSINMTGKEMQPAVHEYARENYPDLKTWYGIVPDNEVGHSDQAIIGPRIEAAGWTILGWEFYDPATTDFYPLLTKMMAKNPDMIDTVTSSPGPVALIWKQLHELGYEGLKLSCAPVAPAQLLSVASAEAAEGGITATFDYEQEYLILESETELRQEAVDRYGATGYDISRVAEGGWDPVQLLVQGMKAAGTVEDTEAIAEAIADLEIDLPDGRKSFGGEETFGIKRMIQGEVMVGVWEDGAYHHKERIRVTIP